ncbi:MAG: phosphopantothenoylcysteine decarboxylase [Pirellulales bacterium]|nr:phosphopantothenoylcysteine decarboxylase [Pirellulales bacterium]
MSQTLEGRRLVIGVAGGVAAYKTAALVSKCVQAGADVSVVITKAAERFVGRATFEALTGRPALVDVFDNAQHPLGAHIDLAEHAELLCVAPATANFLAKAATGMADDLLSTLYLSHEGPVLVAPAMNNAMWSKPSVERNVSQLRTDGAKFVDPTSGWLSCRQQGAGRMAEPESILEHIVAILSGA